MIKYRVVHQKLASGTETFRIEKLIYNYWVHITDRNTKEQAQSAIEFIKGMDNNVLSSEVVYEC